MNETLQVFRVPKSTGTHGDVFAAVGLADLLTSVPDVGAVRIIEREVEFEVCLSRPLREDELSQIPQTPGYLYLKPNNKSSVPPAIRDYLNYAVEKERVERYVKQRTKLRQQKIPDAEIDRLVQQDRPRDDWSLWRALNTLQGDETTNRVCLTIQRMEPKDFTTAVKTGLAALQNQKQSQLRWNVTQSMLFFPTSAKGYRQPKPMGTRRKNFKLDEWSDPFVEWLKYRGYFAVARPRLIKKDVRVIVPIPRDISIRAMTAVSREFRGGRVYGNPPKLDVLAVLKLADLLIRHSEEYHDIEAEIFPGLSLQGKTPAEAISGLMVTHYQSLGNAKAVSAMSTLALPGWFPIESRQDADDWLAILDEHQRIVRGLQDDHSDEIGLLIAYRRVLEKRGESIIWALVEFMEHYGPFLIRAREQNRRVRSFRTDYFRRIVMGTAPKLTEILQNQGFQALAAAVRRATVSAQAQKAMGRSDYREIRYDLLHELRRKRSLPGFGPLIETVSDFVSKYNAENARRREMRKLAPRNVTTEEFAGFAALVELYGPSTVGALLCAYGSCREPRDEAAPESAANEAGTTEPTT